MIEICKLTPEKAGDVRLKNESFSMPGKMIPSLQNGVWSYRIEAFDPVQTMTFPDEAYDFEELSRNGVIFAAYEDGICLGLAIYQEGFFKYMYLYDLKVCEHARRKGVGRALIEAGMQAAKERGYLGLYTQAQDNNLNACMFYLNTGFEIGGFDNHVYNNTPQEGKSDIYFYSK